MDIAIFQIQKSSAEFYEFIQDKYAVSNGGDTVAIADGATQGFKSEIWAKMLVDLFVQEPIFEPERLYKIFEKAALDFRNQEHVFSDNPAIRAVERKKIEYGGFSTFMGVTIQHDNLKYISSGDVCLFIIREGKIVISFPFETIEELDADNGFLGTTKIFNNEQTLDSFFVQDFRISKDDKIVMATDALARYFLKENNTDILKVSNFSEFKDYVIRLWESKILEDDDITLVELSNLSEKDAKIKENIPEKTFSLISNSTEKSDSMYYQMKFYEAAKNLETSKRQIEMLRKKNEVTLAAILKLKKMNMILAGFTLFLTVLFSVLTFLLYKNIEFNKIKINDIGKDFFKSSKTESSKISPTTRKSDSLK